jgi:hypothetical protein
LHLLLSYISANIDTYASRKEKEKGGNGRKERKERKWKEREKRGEKGEVMSLVGYEELYRAVKLYRFILS